MQTPASLRICLLAAALAFVGFPLRAQPVAPLVMPLVVADGKFTPDGKPEPATLKNLVGFIRRNYPKAGITTIDVDDVLINHITIQWRAADGPIVGQPVLVTPLVGVLTALSDASGRKFEVAAFSDNDFVLRRPAAAPRGAPAVEVFNLKPLVRRGNGDLVKDLQGLIDQLEAQRAVLKKRPEKAEQLKDLEDQIAVRRIQIETETHRAADTPAVDVKKLLDQIPELVAMAMSPLAPGEETPDFKYHAGTNLLIVSGSPRAVDATRKVIDALARNP